MTRLRNATYIYDVIPWRRRHGEPVQWAVIRHQAGPCRYVRVGRLHDKKAGARKAAGLQAMLVFRRAA